MKRLRRVIAKRPWILVVLLLLFSMVQSLTFVVIASMI
jgi:hypothetical protein